MKPLVHKNRAATRSRMMLALLVTLGITAWRCSDGILGPGRRVLVPPFDSTYQLSIPLPDMAYRVVLGQQGVDSLAINVRVTNRGDTTTELIWGSCAVGSILYRDEARTDRVPPGRPRRRLGCEDYLTVADLEPDEWREFNKFQWIGEVGEALTAREYFVTVFLKIHPREEGSIRSDTTLEFPGGRLLVW